MMEKIFCLIVLLMLLTASCKKEKGSMIVIKDCTGTYLRFENKDYHVNNPGLLSPFPGGTYVKATFERSSPPSGEEIVCKLLHENEGWVKVKKVK